MPKWITLGIIQNMNRISHKHMFSTKLETNNSLGLHIFLHKVIDFDSSMPTDDVTGTSG